MTDEPITDFSKIHEGDEVKIEFRGLTGWQRVSSRSDRGMFLLPSGWTVFEGGKSLIRVLEHKPAPVKIEITLPTPDRWEFYGLWVDLHLDDLGSADGVEIGNREKMAWLLPENAEQYALAILSLVHEARS